MGLIDRRPASQIRTAGLVLSILGILALVGAISACKNPLAEAAKEIKEVAASPRLALFSADSASLSSGSTYDFGTASKTAPIDALLTIKNTGLGELVFDVGNMLISGTDAASFSVDPPAARLAAGTQTSLGLHFSTTSTVAKTATLTIPTNDVTNPTFILKLTGRGTKAEISSFKVVGLPSLAATGVISGRDITVTLPFGVETRSLTPTIAYTGSNIIPSSGLVQDFANPFTYTVIAVDGLSQIFYTVTVINAGSDAKEITGFEFSSLSPAVTGIIDEALLAITAMVPYGTSTTAMVPSITHTGQLIAPASGVAADFSSPKTYKVTAGNNSEKTYTATVKVRPETPTISSAIPGANTVNLTWASADQATSYNLYWSTSPGVTTATGTKIPGLTGTTYSHTGLSSNTAYYYILASVKADGTESEASAQASALTFPDPPTASTASIAAGGELVVTWAPPASGAVSYNLYYSTGAGVTKAGTTVAGLTGTSTKVTGLTNWTPYYFRVAAVNAAGESASLSNEVSGTPARQELILVNTGGSVDFCFINPATWTRSAPPSSYFLDDASPYSVAVDPGLKAVYVANNRNYAVGTGSTVPFGVGTCRPFDATTGSAPPYALGEGHQEGTMADHLLAVTTPAGKNFLYAAYWSSNQVALYTINADGSLTVNGIVANGFSSPRYLCTDPEGKFLYITNIGNSGSAGVTACAINPNTGDLSWLNGSTAAASSYPTGSGPFRMAITPSGNYLYVGNNTSGTISAFAIASDGKLSAVAGSPFAAGSGTTGVAVDPSGSHLFVTNALANSVSVYTIGAGGVLSGKVDYTGAVNGPSCIALDATGTYAVVTNSGTSNASVFAVAPATGALTAKFAFATGAAPSHVIIVKLP